MAPHDDSSITEQVDSRLDDLFGEQDDKDADNAPIKAEKPSGGIYDGKKAAASHAPADFSDNNKSPMPADGMNTDDFTAGKVDAEEVENSPIKELKSIILSLEWEITDPVMEKLEQEIRKLESICQNDKIALAFLQLLGSLGKYIRKKLAQAHVNSITLLHSSYESLEKAMLLESLSDAAKKKMLVIHVEQYKKLKQEIQSGKKRHNRLKLTVSQAPGSGSTVPIDPEDKPFEGSRPKRSSDVKDPTQINRDILVAMKEMQQTIQNEFSLLREDIRRLLEDKK